MLGLLFSHFNCYNIMLLQHCNAGHLVVICDVLVPKCHGIGRWPYAFLTVETFEIV